MDLDVVDDEIFRQLVEQAWNNIVRDYAAAV